VPSPPLQESRIFYSTDSLPLPQQLHLWPNTLCGCTHHSCRGLRPDPLPSLCVSVCAPHPAHITPCSGQLPLLPALWSRKIQIHIPAICRTKEHRLITLQRTTGPLDWPSPQDA
jgi:hypothetical protein